MPEQRVPNTHIADEWAKFAERVLPASAGGVQRQETKRAYYAGAVALWHRLQRIVSDEPDMTADDEAIGEDLQVEIQDWLRDLREGRA
ncbi:MAG: hypothetical protein AB7G21_09955 [Dehalococcoidia bacterium]